MVFIEEFLTRMGMLGSTFLADPKIYFAIIGEWILILIYFMVSQDKEGLADVYGAGVALGFVGFELMPFHDFYWWDTTVWLSIGLMIYGVAVIILAAAEKIPNIVSRVMGMPSIMFLPIMLIVLYFESNVPIDLYTVIILAIPTIILEAVKLVRQHGVK